MCIILDECLMLMVLALQALTVLPSIAVSRETGIAMLALYLTSAFVSIGFAFLYTLRNCCSCVNHLQRHGAKLFYLLHLGLIAFSIATISTFMKPYFSTTEFRTYCENHGLDDNLSGTSCVLLEGYMVVAVMALTLEIGLSIYMLTIGRRIAKKQAIEYARLVREKSMEDAELPSVTRKHSTVKKGVSDVA
ncbi:hypothetical protein SPRG_04942 [Saprolegnia parasitica CBS 223.65]|uniref:MARVEL domain-containing protein n=1 Tax=Saprolegnia parasitica (strain CBS 223.65) TaxID=695850 RepID=A0A067CKY8_SAPPC|nr:hypothetical protein SPRG_04942 [Saprolegnia parasitica CBS 223.65]KDO29875.1 hypothetical protein SPRG_04942 [Saprolegnia parasitica CBS 223.65]|eukprot:XP_012199470.1 hypothetical protein SPRG_04942 [Saprolegnia parasitica CBS 223.65]